MVANPTRRTENWKDVLDGSDEDAYREIVEPYVNVLLEAARRDLTYYVRNGVLHDGDFSPEELVGEGLIHSWRHREVRPGEMSLRSWLLSTQHRVTRGLVGRFRAYRRDKELSLDEPVTLHRDAIDTQEWFWDWYQPDEQLTWEDVIPSRESDDIEVELNEASRDVEPGDVEGRHALVLHDEFEMSLPDVSFAISRTPDAVTELLKKARATLRERGEEEPSVSDPSDA